MHRDKRGSAIGEGGLALGRDAAGRLEWADVYAAFSQTAATTPMGPVDLELLAVAAYLLGHVGDSIEALQRAYALHVEDGEGHQAIRCAFWLSFHLINNGDFGQAEGWLARADRLLEDLREEGAAHGYVLLPRAFQQVAIIGDYAGGQETAARAADIGRRFGDLDVVALALTLEGRALLRQGRASEGLGLLDEAMVSVVTGEVTAPVAGR